MRRTQLYLETDLWETLRIRSRESGTTISELVRTAVRERYLKGSAQRREAMRALVGLRRDRPEFAHPTYLRRLRQGSRLARLSAR